MILVDTYTTNEQAASALTEGSIYLGGGTLVMRALNYGEQSFDRIVRSSDPVLKQITSSGDQLVLGSAVTMAEVLVNSQAAFLSDVARSVGGPAVRNMATVGGNLFADHPYGDFTVALLALDAVVKMSDGSEIQLESFLASRSMNRGLVVSVSFNRPSGGDFYWKKVSRVKPKGVSVLSIAAWLPQSAGRISNARIAFGAMGETPLRAKQAEASLNGNLLDASTVATACAALSGDFQPPDDALASGWYRNEVAPVHLRRLLLSEGDR